MKRFKSLFLVAVLVLPLVMLTGCKTCGGKSCCGSCGGGAEKACSGSSGGAEKAN